MARKKTTKKDELGQLYDKMGRVAYLLTMAEATLGQAQQQHQALRKQAVGIANQIAKVEAVKKTGGEDADSD